MWARVVEVMLACWLAVSPFIFRHGAEDVLPWVVDYAAAVIIGTASLLSFHPRFRRAHLVTWGIGFVLAGVAFFVAEAPLAAGYQNHLVVGLLLLMFGIVPSRASEPPPRWAERIGPDPSEDTSPRPWDYNPSRWRQRIAVAVVALPAFFIAVYMGLFQWGLIDSVWDPVFGVQTQQVLQSDVSHQMTRWIRLPDAILGAIAYLGDIIFALAGSTRRWQSRPWLVVIFGIDVIPLGIVSAVLVVLQGAVVGSWCFPCLVTAAISLILVVLAYDEVWSSLLYLHRVWKRTGSKRTVWLALIGVPTPEAERAGREMATTAP